MCVSVFSDSNFSAISLSSNRLQQGEVKFLPCKWQPHVGIDKHTTFVVFYCSSLKFSLENDSMNFCFCWKDDKDDSVIFGWITRMQHLLHFYDKKHGAVQLVLNVANDLIVVICAWICEAIVFTDCYAMICYTIPRKFYCKTYILPMAFSCQDMVTSSWSLSLLDFVLWSRFILIFTFVILNVYERQQLKRIDTFYFQIYFHRNTLLLI